MGRGDAVRHAYYVAKAFTKGDTERIRRGSKVLFKIMIASKTKIKKAVN